MTRKQKRNIRQDVTDKIIAALEAGTTPWVKPWKVANGGGLPQKQDTGQAYRGVNIILLMLAGMAYASNEWYTFKQAKARGGMVRKGEKGTMVVFWKVLKKTEVDEFTGEDVERTIPILRQFTVFNKDQIDGLPEVEVEEVPDFERHEAAEATIKATEAKIKFGTAAAYYQPITDSIGMPFRDWFNNPETFYSTTFHELVHWTGSKDRLDRNHKGSFGSEDYAFEELVAEIGSAFLCAEHRIDGQLQHPNYIASWIKGLKDDNNAIFSAAKLAQNAADLIQEGA
jgi:antirestriction protein ArdC